MKKVFTAIELIFVDIVLKILSRITFSKDIQH